MRNKDAAIRRQGKISRVPFPQGERTKIEAFLRFWNDGGVPAWITDISIWGGLFLDLPRRPDTTRDLLFHTGTVPMGINGSFEELVILEFDGWNQGPGGAASVIYGVITYRDVFKSEMKTWFGYILRNDYIQRLAEFPEYNNNS